MNKKPRIAFCFSGQARTLAQTYLFFQKNLFDAAKEQGFDYDVFCAVEDDEDVDKVALLNPTKVEKIKSSEVSKIIDEKWGNKYDQKFLESHCFLFFGREEYFRLPSTFQQFYKVSRSIDLMNGSGKKYDIVIRLRFDCFLFNKINFTEITGDIKKGKVICNKFKTGKNWLRFREINDLFFFGEQRTMSILNKLFNDFFEFEKINDKYKWLYAFFRNYRKFAYYLNNDILRLKTQIIPVISVYLIETLFYKVWTPELMYYNYFINKGAKILKSNFSYILIRKDIEKSIITLEKKNKYEL